MWGTYAEPIYPKSASLPCPFNISIAKTGSGKGLGFVYIIALFTFESRIVFYFITLYLYVNMYIFSPYTTVRNASKGGKPNRKPYHPFSFINLYKTIKQWKKLKFFHEYWIALCREAKKKAEPSSLGDLKILPRNRNEIRFSWIPSQWCST